MALSARRCSRLRLPTSDRFGREPYCQAPAITQGCIIFAPVRDPMTLAGNVASAFRMKLAYLAYPVCCQYDESVIICRSGLPRLSNNASRFSAGFSR